MRWSWRADVLPLVLDGLLEGSLVGVVYLAVAPFGNGSPSVLPLAAFWLAAAAGLAVARNRVGGWLQLLSVPVLIGVAAVGGWLADPATRDALATGQSLGALMSTHPAGVLLGAAVFRGAYHADRVRESDISTDALTYSFPLLGASLLLIITTGGGTAAPVAFAGATVCVVAGLLAIGDARWHEFEAQGPVVRGQTSLSLISGVVVALVVAAVAAAVVVGTNAKDPLFALARSVAATAYSIWAAFLGWLESVLAHNLTGARPVPSLRPSPVPSQTASGFSPSQAQKLYDFTGWTEWAIRAAVVAIAIVVLIILWRLIQVRRYSLPLAMPAAAVREERTRDSFIRRFRPRLSLPSISPRLRFRRRPMSAAQAYLALMDDLADRGELARGPAETPRHHADRAGNSGLEAVPMALLAADYQLAVYGRVPITEPETARAVARWKRLRVRPRHEPPPEAGQWDGRN